MGNLPQTRRVSQSPFFFQLDNCSRWKIARHIVLYLSGDLPLTDAIDGTWRRPCAMEDVSETGARLTVDGSIEGLQLKEFFLLLSTMGKAYRRCQLAWVNGDEIGVFFLKPGEKKKKS